MPSTVAVTVSRFGNVSVNVPIAAGVQAPAYVPSPASWSGQAPSSRSVTVWPSLTGTTTSPFGWSQLIWSAERVNGSPTNARIVLLAGSSRDNTTAFVHSSEPRAFSRRPVIVTGATLSPPDRIRFLIARQSRDGTWALSSAATPVTCGVAIDVPENTE